MSKRQPILTAFLTFALCVFFVVVSNYLEERRFIEESRARVISQLSQVRADMEAAINANFYLTRGLIAAIVAEPDITQEKFILLAKSIFRYNPGLRNIGLAPANVISFIYPLEGNEKALGFDYAENPQQWPVVKRAMEAGTTIVAGPVKLVQGGEGFISRTPVFLFSEDGTQGQYWGMASVVLDKKYFLEQAGFYRSDRRLALALRGKDGLGAAGETIEGDPRIFDANPVSQLVRLPSGSWQIAALPLEGWKQHSPLFFAILSGGGTISLLAGWLAFWWSRRQCATRLEIEGARSRAEEATRTLARNESFLNAVLDNIPSLIFVKDAKQLKYVRVNSSWERLVGISNNEVAGKLDFEIYPEAQALSFTTQDREVLESKEPLDIPLERFEVGDRLLCLLHTRKIPIQDDQGDILYILGFSEDLTEAVTAQQEREELERQLEHARRLESIGLMAAGVAHDLNNILAGIVGYPELLLARLAPDSDLRKPLQDMHDSGRRAATVVADLLTVARGAASLKKPEDLHVLISDYMSSPEFTKLQAVYPDIQYDLKLEAQDSTIHCSAVHIKKSLMNLVANASEAIMGEGLVTIRTSNLTLQDKDAEAKELSPGRYLLLEVADDGPGIPATLLDHIFEPFFTRKVMGRSGTGLGLTVVWNTMADHQGRIEVTSDTQGSVFHLFFPVYKEESLLETIHEKSAIPLGCGETILVVDDEKLLRDLACQMLESLNYQVYTANSGEKALEFIANTPVDLVILDMLMEPGMNGLTTYQALLPISPGQKAIIVSGYSEGNDVTAALDLGAAAFIQKPYLLEQLGRLVRKVLDDTPAQEG